MKPQQPPPGAPQPAPAQSGQPPVQSNQVNPAPPNGLPGASPVHGSQGQGIAPLQPPSIADQIAHLAIQADLMGKQQAELKKALAGLIGIAEGQPPTGSAPPAAPPQHQQQHNPQGHHVPHHPNTSMKPHHMEHPAPGGGISHQNIAGGIPGFPDGANVHNAVTAGVVSPNNPAVLNAQANGVRLPSMPHPKGFQ